MNFKLPLIAALTFTGVYFLTIFKTYYNNYSDGVYQMPDE